MAEEQKCDSCGAILYIGMWPFCGGDSTKHGDMMAYRPFVPFWDSHVATRDKWEHPNRGIYVDSPSKWNRVMKENGWELGSKYDRERPHPMPHARGLDQAFNKSVREMYGGVLPVGSFLRDDDGGD